MSGLINESLVGDQLIIPGDRNVFSIAAGAMPNGDDCLQVTSNTTVLNGQAAVIVGVGPDSYVLNASTPTDAQAVTFWIKRQQSLANGNGASDREYAGTSSTLMGVGAAAAVSQPTGTIAATASDAMPWCVQHSSASVISFSVIARHVFSGTTYYFSYSALAGLVLDTWHLIMLETPTNGMRPNTRIWRDGALQDSNQPAADRTLHMRERLTASHQFAIGDPTNRPSSGPQGVADGPLYQIGKLAFHDSVPTVEQQQALIESMTSGPPA